MEDIFHYQKVVFAVVVKGCYIHFIVILSSYNFGGVPVATEGGL